MMLSLSSFLLLALGLPQGSGTFSGPSRVSMVDPVPAPLGGVWHANLTEDGVPDAVVLSAGQPVVLYGGVQYRRRIPLEGVVADLAVVRRAGQDHTDALVTASEVGVHDWRWSEASEQFVSATVLQGAAQHVAATNRAEPEQHLAVLLDGGLRVLVFSSAGGGAAYVQERVIDLALPAAEIAVLDYAAGEFHLAVTHDAGLSVLDDRGVEVVLHPRTAASEKDLDRLAVLSDNGVDLVAWLERATGVGSSLHVLGAGSSEMHDVGAFEPVELAVGDLLGDTEPDLALTRDGSGGVVVLENGISTGTAFFDPAKAVLLQAKNPLPGNTGGLACGDLDNDGDGDLLVADNVNDAVWTWRGAAIDDLSVGPLQPHHVPGPELPRFFEGFFAAISFYCGPPMPLGATEVEVYAWTRPEEGSSLTPAPGMPLSIDLEDACGMDLNLYFPASETDEYAFIDLHPVRRVPGEPPVAYPGLKAVLSPQDGTVEPSGDPSDPYEPGMDYEEFLSPEYQHEGAFFTWTHSSPPDEDTTVVTGEFLGGAPMGGIIIRIPEIPLDPPGGG